LQPVTQIASVYAVCSKVNGCYGCFFTHDLRTLEVSLWVLCLPHLTVCPGTETAFETNAETINSLMFNQLRGVSAFSPVFL
jgi:hypothetical protein